MYEYRDMLPAISQGLLDDVLVVGRQPELGLNIQGGSIVTNPNASKILRGMSESVDDGFEEAARWEILREGEGGFSGRMLQDACSVEEFESQGSHAQDVEDGRRLA